jgi:adenylate cyclase
VSLPAINDDEDIPPATYDAAQRQTQRAFIREALTGLRMATRIRLLCVPFLMLFAAYLMRGDAALWFVELCLVAYALHGVAELWLVQRMADSGRRKPGAIHAMIALEMALIAFAMFGSQGLFEHPWPPQAFVDSRPVVFFFFVISLYAFNFSPWLMIWAALCAAVAWSPGMTWLLLLPDTVITLPTGLLPGEVVAATHDPHFVNIDAWIQDVLLLMLTGFVLAGVVWRTRRLVRSQIAAARERANLARHFAPTMVDEIAGHDGMLEEVHRQDVAVMFTDVVGFTHLAETLEPEATVAVLRGLHRRIEKAVFDNGGTLDKFLGDGAMATFGTPRTGPRDAANALDAARAALAAVDKWNAKRTARGASPVRLSVGLHYGSVVLGDLGSNRRLEYAVIGDTVNVAARIEHMTRALDARIAASDSLIERAREQGADLAGLEATGTHDIRGRDESVVLWRLPL